MLKVKILNLTFVFCFQSHDSTERAAIFSKQGRCQMRTALSQLLQVPVCTINTGQASGSATPKYRTTWGHHSHKLVFITVNVHFYLNTVTP